MYDHALYCGKNGRNCKNSDEPEIIGYVVYECNFSYFDMPTNFDFTCKENIKELGKFPGGNSGFDAAELCALKYLNENFGEDYNTDWGWLRIWGEAANYRNLLTLKDGDIVKGVKIDVIYEKLQ